MQINMEYLAQKNKYSDIILTIEPVLDSDKIINSTDRIAAFDQFKLISALDILNSTKGKFNPTGLKVCHYDADTSNLLRQKLRKYKDNLLGDFKLPFDILVSKLFDYQGGEFNSMFIGPMNIIYRLENGYCEINSLNPPDMYLYRFIMSLVQNQKVDCKIKHDRVRYGIGTINIEFEIANIKFNIECTGDIGGIYTHLYVEKALTLFDIIDIFKETGYYKSNLSTEEYKNHYLRYTRQDGY